eukprot:2924467-Alexandrium_andersonii.AAC.1
MGALASEAAAGGSAVSNWALKVMWRGSRLPLPRAELDRPAAGADRLKASANPLATRPRRKGDRPLGPAPGRP